MYTFAPQRAKGWQTGVACTICQPLFCQLYCQSGGQEVGPTSPSPSQRYNTLDFASKVVCHETPCAVSLDSSGCTASGFGEGTPQQVRLECETQFQFLKLWPQVDTCLSLFSKLFPFWFSKGIAYLLIYQRFAAKYLPCLAKHGIHVIRKFDASRSTEGRPP